MNSKVDQISLAARSAVQKRDWATVHAAATAILRHEQESAEGHFLMGLVEKAAQHPAIAVNQFETALRIDDNRHDAAIELADQLIQSRRNGDAKALIDKYVDRLSNSPRYLDMAATVLSNIGLNQEAWPLYEKANRLQPNMPLFRANLAACAVFVGKIDEAAQIYKELLANRPSHQRNHYHLSRLAKATDDTHIREMTQLIEANGLPPDKNVYLYYAIGKEYEDLEDWDKAFQYLKTAGDAVASVANYSIMSDLTIIDTIKDVCDADWLQAEPAKQPTDVQGKTPCFVLGLPRTGTTLTERIISSHSEVQTIGETEFIEFALRLKSGVQTQERMSVDIIRAAGQIDSHEIANEYLNRVAYVLDDEPIFIDKLPHNFMYLGFIAKAFPDAKFVHLNRHPMDACFAMYKQVFTWAFKFSYTLDGIADFYIAYTQLMDHWRSLLGDRLIDVTYESLVANQEVETRRLLEKLDLDFEDACLNFEKNTAASATASSVQVREKIHSRSVDKWKRFERQLQPLAERLTAAGIDI
ncbi:MAG: sulfotransferase [Gammaproteobacteria bacterium]|nr:sulfotransferase [Gammaproteobacteria bacterium]